MDKNKYLGVTFSEKKDYTLNAGNFAAAGGRALGAIISKIHSLNEFGIKTYGKLYSAALCLLLTTALPFGVIKTLVVSIPFKTNL
jgi:hypothetical protein